MFNPPSFAELSHPRQRLLRLCQVVNYGHIENLLVRDREVLLDAGMLAFTDLKLDSEDRPRDEIRRPDFLLCNEIVRLFAALDRIADGKISRLDVRGGIPRRILLEASISDIESRLRQDAAATQNLPVARQAGSKGPVRRLMVDSERETAAEEAAGHRRDARGGRSSEGRSRRGYPETTHVGDCLGS